jgi:hypothetical protein
MRSYSGKGGIGEECQLAMISQERIITFYFTRYTVAPEFVP